MKNQKLFDELAAIVSEKTMLKHPFYQCWQAGKLEKSELQEYMKQYYHLEGVFPRLMSSIHANCTDAAMRQTMLQNLRGEEEGANNHLAQLVTFSKGLGLTEADLVESKINESTQTAVNTLLSLTQDKDINKGLAMLAAYKEQIGKVASTKESGLKELYGITDPATLQFFTTHAKPDKSWHELLDKNVTADEYAPVLESVSATCGALLKFLDGVTTPSMLTRMNSAAA